YGSTTPIRRENEDHNWYLWMRSPTAPCVASLAGSVGSRRSAVGASYSKPTTHVGLVSSFTWLNAAQDSPKRMLPNPPRNTCGAPGVVEMGAENMGDAPAPVFGQLGFTSVPSALMQLTRTEDVVGEVRLDSHHSSLWANTSGMP